MSKVLVAGYGSVGQYLVDFLLKDHRIENLDQIHIMSRKSYEEVSPRIKISEISAGISERFIKVVYHECDFNNVDQMASIISLIKPDVIVYTGRYFSGVKYGSFSYPNGIGYGAWLPLAFPYIYNLMVAVRQSSPRSKVINTSFPDAINPLLRSSGNNLAPYCGAGNINHLIPRIKKAASTLFDTPTEDLSITLACSHYVNTYVSKEGTERRGNEDGPPLSLLRIFDRKRGVWLVKEKSADPLDQDPLKKEIFKMCKDNSATGKVRNQMVATDCAEITRMILTNSTRETIHLPGVREGGLKFNHLGYGTPEVTNELYDDLESCDKVNHAGLWEDGVSVRSHGVVEFRQSLINKMSDVFNINYPNVISYEKLRDFADEIVEGLKEYSKRKSVSENLGSK